MLMNDSKTVKSTSINTKYIDVLDGIRAFAILIIMAFHFWQQAWITPEIDTPFLEFLGISNLSSYSLLSTGYELVDLMIFLSAFCLFLPYARAMIHGGDTDSVKTFYEKRVARIFPSYYFCIILLFIYNLATGGFSSTEFMWRDLLTHLTFTQMFTYDTYVGTVLNVVLWTISIEVMFYIIFPFIARAFKKFPVLTYFIMVIVSLSYVHLYVLGTRINDIRLLVNSFPSFLSVFANGMMGALVFVALAKRLKREKYTEILFTALTIASLMLIYYILKNHLAVISAEDGQIWQIKYRYIMSFIFGIFVISCALSARWLRVIFANPVTKFLAGISMNLYIWHQWLCVFIKYDLRIPHWTGDTPPNISGDLDWQWAYLIIIVIASIAVAVLTTYLIEKPCANFILKRKIKKISND